MKAGQTKFKTAALEYVRALGLDPRVMASSNHLGNNDMKNLLAPALCKAKMRVKEDIFARWRQQGWAKRLDHQVWWGAVRGQWSGVSGQGSGGRGQGQDEGSKPHTTPHTTPQVRVMYKTTHNTTHNTTGAGHL